MSEEPAIASENKREFARTTLHLPGQIFNPATNETIDCEVLNLSPSGAGMKCDAKYTVGTELVLYVDMFGRFEGHTIEQAEGRLGLGFSFGEKKRGRLSEMLRAFAEDGMLGVTFLRRHPRVVSLAKGTVWRANGEILSCDIIDISPDGINLRVKTRPPIGEILNLGRTKGRVVRHHEDGIGVQYVQVA